MTIIKVDVPQADVEITPELLAEAFWRLDDGEQSQFFVALKNVVEEDCGLNSKFYAEFQWISMAKKIKETDASEFAKHFAECILYEEEE